MNPAPPSSPGPRIEQQGDTLVVTFRARRSGLVFLGIWFTFWTYGGLAALHELRVADRGTRVFFLFWLCGWAIGELLAAVLIAWQLAGRDVLTVTPTEIGLRRQLGRYDAETGKAHVLAVEDVSYERVPDSEDEKRADFRLRIVVADRSPLLVGEGMDEHVADYVASVVRSYVRPQRLWGADETTSASAPVVPEPVSVDGGLGRRLLRALLLPAIVGAIALVASGRLSDHHPPPARGATGDPPDRRRFDDPGAYAIAMTRFSLESAHTKVETTPTCGTSITWSRWTCRALGRSRTGPLAGRALVYRCFAVEAPPPASAVECGPEPSPIPMP